MTLLQETIAPAIEVSESPRMAELRLRYSKIREGLECDNLWGRDAQKALVAVTEEQDYPLLMEYLFMEGVEIRYIIVDIKASSLEMRVFSLGICKQVFADHRRNKLRPVFLAPVLTQFAN